MKLHDLIGLESTKGILQHIPRQPDGRNTVSLKLQSLGFVDAFDLKKSIEAMINSLRQDKNL